MKKLEFDYADWDEFEKFLDKLSDKDVAKLLATINQIEEQGLLVAERMQWVKKLDNNLFEIRSKLGSNIQRAIYFHVESDRYVITHGFTKKTQKTPDKEKKKAKKIRDIFLHRRNNNE